MRVLHFYRTLIPDSMGGIEQVIDQIATGTRKRGVEVDALSLGSRRGAASFDINGYRAHRTPLNFQIASTGFSFAAFRRFARLARQADVIHYHFPWPFMDMVHFATRIKKPCVLTYHSDVIRQRHLLKFYRPLQSRFLGDMQRIVATSPNYFASSGVLTRFRNKVEVIPIGLDKSSYPQPDPARLARWRGRFGLKFFLFVGVLRYYKGLHLLIEAAKGTPYPVVIVGAGPIERQLKAQVAAMGLDNIHFLGFLPEADKVALLQLSYATIFPSHLRSEAFGVSLLEGAMYGKPMISSEIGTGTSFVNAANETGLVIPPNDPRALRSAMQYLWTHPEQAAAMGARAEERYHRLFTADRMADSYLRLYRDLTGK